MKNLKFQLANGEDSTKGPEERVEQTLKNSLASKSKFLRRIGGRLFLSAAYFCSNTP